jgi:membrane protease YdiL (CAAX protease family)
MAFLIDALGRVRLPVARPAAGRVRPELWAAAGLSAGLLAYGNGTSLFSHDAREAFLLWSNLGLVALLLAWALARARFSLAELGLGLGAARGSAMFGVVLSVLAALPPVAFVLLAPLYNGGPVEAEDITGRSGGELAYFVLFRQPVGTALFEELAFRGVLYAAWLRAGGDRLAVVASSAVFAAWHVVITSRTVAESGVVDAPAAVAGGVAVSLLGLLVGGLIFAYLRWHTRSIAAAAVAHWLIVAEMTVAVWLMG